jgi:mannosyltransferase OCH1-like enzyme
MIPKKIHQIWLGKNAIPKKFSEYRDKILNLHPGWEYFLWTDELKEKPYGNMDISQFDINKVYYLSSNLGHRSDILRYQLMYTYGGIYLDTDMEIQKTLNDFLKLESFIVEGPPQKWKFPQTVENAVLGSEKNNLFFSFLLNQIPIHYGNGEDVVEKTGAHFISFALHRYKEVFGIDPPITIIPRDLFYPYFWYEKEKKDLNFPNSYGIHRWWGSWWK